MYPCESINTGNVSSRTSTSWCLTAACAEGSGMTSKNVHMTEMLSVFAIFSSFRSARSHTHRCAWVLPAPEQNVMGRIGSRIKHSCSDIPTVRDVCICGAVPKVTVHGFHLRVSCAISRADVHALISRRMLFHAVPFCRRSAQSTSENTHLCRRV